MHTLALLAVTASIVFAPSRSRAQPTPMDPAEAAYLEGRRYYDLHDWKAAIAKFKEAYRLRADAASLFDIAQAYRLDGDCDNAKSFYKAYERNFPTAPNIAKVDKLLAALDSCVPARVAPPITHRFEPLRPTPAPVATIVPSGPTLLPVVDDPGAGRAPRIAGVVLAGAGVAAIGVGTIFGLDARAKANAAESGHGTWNSSLERDGTSAATTAESLWATGAAAIVVGGAIYLLGRHEAPRVTVDPRGHGATVGVSCVW